MVLAALLVAIVSALAAMGGLAYSRRSAQAADKSAEAAEKSADAAAVTAQLDVDRRHSELTPRFRITCEPAGGPGGIRMTIALTGPPELERLDELIVTVRDDHPWRAQGSPPAGGPTLEQVARQIWGLWRFIPHTGPGAGTSPELLCADDTGRTTRTAGLPVGEQLPFFLEPNRPPSWSQWTADGWEQTVGSKLRLQLDCRHGGWERWSLPCEIQIKEGAGHTALPPDNLPRDELASTQRIALETTQRLREREQAESVDITWQDTRGQPGRSLAVVINGSRRPIFSLVVRGQVVQNASSLLPALSAGEMYPSAIPTSEAPPDPWTYRGGIPGDRLESLRPSGRAGFECGFPHTAWPDGRLFVRFTDDAGLHWQLDQEHHLERLNERDW